MFRWIIHGGEDYANAKCMFIKEAGEYKKLYSLYVLGVEDRGRIYNIYIYILYIYYI